MIEKLISVSPVDVDRETDSSGRESTVQTTQNVKWRRQDSIWLS